MHLPGIFPLIIVAILVLVLFGRGRISEMMGDFGKGIRSFKEGIRDEPEAPQSRIDVAPNVITPETPTTIDSGDRT